MFLGPSLERERAEAILPEAQFLPPVCQGQLMSAVDRYRPQVVAVIDGEFTQSLAVWHKEILQGLAAGISVVGASSMGALRAAECDVYGMIGVGKVYEWYRDGVLTDDDEVALLYRPEDEGWQNLSWPLVNVRATTEQLCRERRMEADTAEAVIQALKPLYFGDRCEARLTDELSRVRAGGGRRRPDAVATARLVARGYVDQKRLDAIELLEQVAAGLPGSGAPRRVPRDTVGWFAPALRDCDTEVSRRRGTVLRHEIIDHAALFEADFEAVQERALHRAIAVEYARELGTEPSVEELAKERGLFLSKHGITEETIDSWLADNDLSPEQFATLVHEEAQLHRLRKWYLNTVGYERNRRAVATELRLEGRYPEVAERAARQATLTSRAELDVPTEVERASRLLAEHQVLTGWKPSMPLLEWIDEHGFANVQEFWVAVSAAASARREQARRRERLGQVFAAIMPTHDGAGEDGR